MFVDASVLVALMLQEPEARALSQVIAAAADRVTSPIAMFETMAVVMSRRGAARHLIEDELRAVLSTAKIDIIPITDEIGRAALDAFDRYGKGRGHPAQLNMGDCFAYAAARVRGVRLLYKGDDFARTDMERAGD